VFTYLCLHCSSCTTPIPSSGTPTGVVRPDRGDRGKERFSGLHSVKTATEVGVRAIQDHKVIEWNTCWKYRLSEGSDDK
jgi:hypothetical protein